jgi:predicted RNA-binding Zn-ribbon protein involved in translation (DUF1610 family)
MGWLTKAGVMHELLPGIVAKSARAPGGARDNFRLEPHICRVCHTRLVSAGAGSDGRKFECPNCGSRATGHDAAVLCCCGMKIHRLTVRGSRKAELVDAGIRCAPNPHPTPEFPSVYIATEAGPEC